MSKWCLNFFIALMMTSIIGILLSFISLVAWLFVNDYYISAFLVLLAANTSLAFAYGGVDHG